MKGLIIIPDITGFTNFVKNINIDLGVTITSELLNEIIDSNPLELEISEIEGDAILFYKMGAPIAVKEVFEGLKTIYDAFTNKLESLKSIYNVEADLSLKFIVHYGEISVYNIRGFKKLYGQTVIEAHCLLKNGNGKTSYVLITDDYLYSSSSTSFITTTAGWKYSTSNCKNYAGLGNINYCFYMYSGKEQRTSSSTAGVSYMAM
ncbi:MAG: hypothetical protein JWQ96_1787 [Segetibacter sp.]|nr:hypothetical protein [Segetibacter sp.]